MAARKRKPPAVRWPWDPVTLEPHEISALKAMDQVAVNALLKLAGYGANPFCGGDRDGERATSFACGKHWVGGTLLGFRAIKMPGARPAASGPHAAPPSSAPPNE